MSKEVLLVEDDDALRDTLTLLLQLKDFSVDTACNGQEALDRLRDGSRPCLILLDLMMPEVDGWEFRRRQLADPELADVPVIVMTGASIKRNQREALRAVDLLTKPVDIPYLFALLSEFC